MPKLNDAQLVDLSRLARDRCRKAVMTVGQLIDDEEQRAAVLTFCAADFIRGSAEYLKGCDSMSAEQACEFIITQLLTDLGVKFEKRAEP